MKYKFHHPVFFGIQVMKEVAFLADESEKISDSKKKMLSDSGK